MCPCSIESMPARSAFLIPSAPMACAATRRPWRCASEMAASSSSGSSCALPGTAPLVRTPPVAITLTQSAPAKSSSRTALRASHGPSVCRPRNHPWPPVMQSTRPAARIRGPGTAPRAIASRRSAAIPKGLPTSRTDVTPARSVLAAFSTAASIRVFCVIVATATIVLASPFATRWTCAFTSPGVTQAAVRSTTELGTASWMSATRSPSMTTSTLRRGGASVPS